MIVVLVGLLTVLVGCGLFVGGFFFGIWVEKTRTVNPKEQPALTEEQKKARQEMIDYQNAFEQQMHYNADMAYGLDSMNMYDRGDAI